MDKKILEYCGIYETHKLEMEKEKVILKVKDSIVKEIHKPINKIYIYGQYAWGKTQDTNHCNVMMYFDVRLKDLDAYNEILEKYNKEYTNITFSLCSLCQFEKRKNVPTEYEYYVFHHGILIYDDKRKTNIHEKVVTNYGAAMDTYRYLVNSIAITEKSIDPSLCSLLNIYFLKRGYFYQTELYDLEKYIGFAKLISNETDLIIHLINNYKKSTSFKEKVAMYNSLKKYILEQKQKKFDLNLKYRPSMHIYDVLNEYKQNGGTLLVNEITPEELYTMYNLEKITADRLMDLYNMSSNQYNYLKNKYKIKILSGIVREEAPYIKKLLNDPNFTTSYSELKEYGIIVFEPLIKIILEYMRDGSIYLLHEFFKFCDLYEATINENMIYRGYIKYYRAVICLTFLTENRFVDETGYYEYQITNKGIELLNEMQYQDTITLPDIYHLFSDITFYGTYLDNLEKVPLPNTLDKPFINTIKDKEVKEMANFPEQVNLTEVTFEKSKSKKALRKKENFVPIKTDFTKMNQTKSDIGKYGEELVLEYEKNKLISLGHEELADKVIWISQEIGDGAGYDIISYECINGKFEQIYIEVKTTVNSHNTEFDITLNEINASNLYKEKYYIYRIGNIHGKNPKFYKENGRIEDNYDLIPTQFKAIKK
ncbi:MAG: DUF3883 domain-containing protein [Clostridia bacterium]|nr:DUF3883 domain-containing protein [Clostridia bacterium]